MFSKPIPMDPVLRILLDQAKEHLPTPRELWMQRVSFVYGNLPGGSTVTRAMVEQLITETHGPCPEAPSTTIANFEYPMDLYGENGNLSLEDWLANFYVETEQEAIETPPPSESNPMVTVAVAVFQSTELGGLTITREMLVALFTEEAVVKVELDASLAYLGSLSC